MEHFYRNTENALYRADYAHLLQYPGVYEMFLAGCICADAYTLYTVFDTILTQNPVITLSITVTVAAVLNLSMVLLAACLNNRRFPQKTKLWLSRLLLGCFAVPFLCCFALRLSTGQMLLEGGAGISGLEGTSQKFTLAHFFVLVILGLEPALTSGLSFYISLENDPERKKRHLKRLACIQAEERLRRNRVARQELEQDMAFDLEDYDRQMLAATLEILSSYADTARAKAAKALAEKEGTPEAVDAVMEADLPQTRSEQPTAQ